MDLAQQKQTVLDSLVELVEEGSTLRDKINSEYRSKRSNSTFDTKVDIPRWKKDYVTWFQKSLKMIEAHFSPAVFLVNRFKNPPMDAGYLAGENMEWNSLSKNLNARLELLGNVYETVAGIQESELSDFLEFTVGVPGVAGAKIKVDKIISRIFIRR
jgi:hypothetical protein